MPESSAYSAGSIRMPPGVSYHRLRDEGRVAGSLIRGIGEKEGMPVVVHRAFWIPSFLAEVLEEQFAQSLHGP